MSRLRVVTYNIHKGVQGLGPLRRLEVHNLAAAVQRLAPDVLCLQEVRLNNRREAQHFALWPAVGQAEVLAPAGYAVAYRSNAITRHGEHGNAVLARWPITTVRHEDMSDHRLEQRGLLHVTVAAPAGMLHVIVLHLGLVRASRRRQLAQVVRYVLREVPAQAPLLVAGDFNESKPWMGALLAQVGLQTLVASPLPTFPARWPLTQLDHVFARGLRSVRAQVPLGRDWWRLSDHLPLVVDCAWNA